MFVGSSPDLLIERSWVTMKKSSTLLACFALALKVPVPLRLRILASKPSWILKITILLFPSTNTI